MRHIFVTSALIVLACSLTISQKNDYDQLSPLIEGPVEHRLKRITELHAQGKHSIALLVDYIDRNEVVAVELVNPFSSSKQINSPVYIGMVAAYLIEVILSQSELTLRPFLEPGNFLLCGGPGNYPYISGRIIAINSNKPITIKDLRNIKKIYATWWRANEKNTIDELRENWKAGNRPLSKSPYGWK